MTRHEIPDEAAWNAWHPAELAARLADVGRPWCVVGGWALDLWHGRMTRDHHDLEFTVLREDLDCFRRALCRGQARVRGEGAPHSDFAFYAVNSGVFHFLPEAKDPDVSIGQIWCWDIEAACWRVDMMIESGTPDSWVCKRDRSITRPRNEMVLHSTDGIPYLNPAAILLLKAKHQRPKDEADFEAALPKLGLAERTWLKLCLARLHSDHVWIERL